METSRNVGWVDIRLEYILFLTRDIHVIVRAPRLCENGSLFMKVLSVGCYSMLPLVPTDRWAIFCRNWLVTCHSRVRRYTTLSRLTFGRTPIPISTQMSPTTHIFLASWLNTSVHDGPVGWRDTATGLPMAFSAMFVCRPRPPCGSVPSPQYLSRCGMLLYIVRCLCATSRLWH
jgi:hypothetical protein